MSALASLQRGLQTLVLSGSDSERIGASVVGTPAAGVDARLGVYVHAYRARLIELLGNDFPGLQLLAGANAFDSLCRAYIDATPSKHYNVRWYGEHLPEFLRSAAPWSTTPALAEMALLEWTLSLSFDAADENPVRAAEVEALHPAKWPDLRVRLHGSVHRLTLHWNVGEVRRAVDRGEASPPRVEFDTPQPWVVSRSDTLVRHRSMPADEAAALEAAANGARIAELCEVLCEWHDDDAVAMRAATLLGQWVRDQWIAELLHG